MADNYTEVTAPKATTAFDEANKAAARLIKPSTQARSCLGCSRSRAYNDTDECNARPVAEDTCLMFPGHSKLEWTFAVNAWIFGAMVGSLCCGLFSDTCGRLRVKRLVARSGPPHRLYWEG
ncbi:major Facilitator Superfamily (MFS)-like protein, partial [Phytophthora infestans T30-4]